MDKKILEEIFRLSRNRVNKEAENEPLFDFFMEKAEWFGDPEEMHVMITAKFLNIISQVVKHQLNTDDWLIQDIYRHWGLFGNNTTRLCEQFYGSACCADRGRCILKSAIRWRLTGELPEFRPEIEGNFHHPKSGTPEQWMKYVEGIGKLRHGNITQFLEAYKDLSESREVWAERKNKQMEAR